MAELQLVERRVYHLKANWKLIIQNYSECLHCPIVHPLLQKQSHYMSGDNEPPQPTYLGGRMDLRDGVQTLTMDGSTKRCSLPGLGADDQRHVYYYCLLPNFFLNLHPDYMLTFTMWPKAADQTDIICEWHFHPDEINKPDSIRGTRLISGTSPTSRIGNSPIWRSKASGPGLSARALFQSRRTAAGAGQVCAGGKTNHER